MLVITRGYHSQEIHRPRIASLHLRRESPGIPKVVTILGLVNGSCQPPPFVLCPNLVEDTVPVRILKWSGGSCKSSWFIWFLHQQSRIQRNINWRPADWIVIPVPNSGEAQKIAVVTHSAIIKEHMITYDWSEPHLCPSSCVIPSWNLSWLTFKHFCRWFTYWTKLR